MKASIGAVEGERSSPGGLLRERVTEEDGHVVLAADLRGEAATQSVTDSVGVAPAEVVSFAYYTEGDDTIGAPLTARMNGSDDATTAGERIDELLGVAGMGVENESVRAQLDDVNVTTDGATMSVRYESSVAEVNAVVDYLYGSRYARPSGTV